MSTVLVSIVGVLAIVSIVPSAAQSGNSSFGESQDDYNSYLNGQGRPNSPSDPSYTTRYNRWAANVQAINAQNARFARGQETYGMAPNLFTDMSSSEMARYLGQFPSKTVSVQSSRGLQEEEDNFELDDRITYPTSLDLRTSTCMPAIENQGACGSCWAFAAVMPIEYQYCQKYAKLVYFSEQQIVSCSNSTYGNAGCSGGMYSGAWNYLIQNSGLENNTVYPYTSGAAGANATCQFSSTKVQAKVSSWNWLTPIGNSNDTVMIAGLNTYGPLAVAIYANTNFQNYATGVFKDSTCSTTNINHAVALVGYGTSTTAGPYWIVRNQWGTNWGMSGYILMARNVNQCNINWGPAYVKIV